MGKGESRGQWERWRGGESMVSTGGARRPIPSHFVPFKLHFHVPSLLLVEECECACAEIDTQLPLKGIIYLDIKPVRGEEECQPSTLCNCGSPFVFHSCRD